AGLRREPERHVLHRRPLCLPRRTPRRRPGTRPAKARGQAAGSQGARRRLQGKSRFTSLGEKAASFAWALSLLALVAGAPFDRPRAQGTSEAVDPTALRVCADPGNLPFSNEAEEGFENKIAELLAAELGVPVRYTWYPQA